jgi:hypothetical protein
MAAAVAGPLLSAELSALVGLGAFAEPSKEEVFAPFCGKWIKVSYLFMHTDPASMARSMSRLVWHVPAWAGANSNPLGQICIDSSMCHLTL